MSCITGVSHEFIEKFNLMKHQNMYQFIIAKINANDIEGFDKKIRNIVIEVDSFKEYSKDIEPTIAYQDFIEYLPKSECRYCYYNFNSKIILIVWVPESAKIKDKMYSCSFKETMKKVTPGISHEIGATDLTEMDYQDIQERLNWKIK